MRNRWIRAPIEGLLALAVILGGLFNVGCAGVVRGALAEAEEALVERGKELLDQAKAKGAELLQAAEAKATAVAEAKIAEWEEKQYAGFDAQLAKLGTVDEVTGAAVARTWRDFDVDKSSSLEVAELAKLQAFVAGETARRVMAGSMTKDEAFAINGDVAKGAGAVSLLGAATWAINRRRKSLADSKPPPPTAAPPPPPPPGAGAPVPKPV